MLWWFIFYDLFYLYSGHLYIEETGGVLGGF